MLDDTNEMNPYGVPSGQSPMGLASRNQLLGSQQKQYTQQPTAKGAPINV